MSTPPPPPPDPSRPDFGHPEAPPPQGPAADPPAPPAAAGPPADGYDSGSYVPVTPLLAEDPPRLGSFWLDARLAAAPSGVAYTGHDDQNQPAMVILLSEGAAEDAAARDRFAGVVNKMHIDTVLSRGGHGQESGRLGKRFRSEDDDPVSPDERQTAPWAALVYDGSHAAAAEAQRVLAEVQLSALVPLGRPAGPDYRHYWIDRVRPGLARLWPLPWPGRYDRAGWKTILVSWLLTLLIGALAVLIAILIFRNQAPESPPPPAPQTGSPPPQSSSPSPQSASPSPQSASPSPQSASPSPGSPSPGSASPSPESASGSPNSPSSTPSMSGSQSGSPSPSGTESAGGQPTPSDSGSPGSSNSPGSKL